MWSCFSNLNGLQALSGYSSCELSAILLFDFKLITSIVRFFLVTKYDPAFRFQIDHRYCQVSLLLLTKCDPAFEFKLIKGIVRLIILWTKCGSFFRYQIDHSHCQVLPCYQVRPCFSISNWSQVLSGFSSAMN